MYVFHQICVQQYPHKLMKFCLITFCLTGHVFVSEECRCAKQQQRATFLFIIQHVCGQHTRKLRYINASHIISRCKTPAKGSGPFLRKTVSSWSLSTSQINRNVSVHLETKVKATHSHHKTVTETTFLSKLLLQKQWKHFRWCATSIITHFVDWKSFRPWM